MKFLNAVSVRFVLAFIQAVLDGVPENQLLLLDLYADRHPQWKRTESFYGRPFVWCMLHNFGGNNDMHGAASTVAQVRSIKFRALEHHSSPQSGSS